MNDQELINLCEEIQNKHSDKFIWVTNHDLKYRRMLHFHEIGNPQLSKKYDDHYKEWLNEHKIGKPKSTEKYSIEELKTMGLVGVYSKVVDYCQYIINNMKYFQKETKDYFYEILQNSSNFISM